MATITVAQVAHVAKLAQLKLSAAEIKKFQKQLAQVVNYVSELQKVDTSKIEPTSQTTGLTNQTRADQVDPNQGLNLENDYFIVPRLIEKDDF
jgi:aspartyl/glutamyl-tRNA(Asn/Gln) amidotransferase C subunit